MKYYKNKNNQVFALEDNESPDEWINDLVTEISFTEASRLTQPSPSELISNAESDKQSRLFEATNAIAPYQDAIDLGIATDKELKQLNAWKQYRVDLNRIDTATAPDITWPEKPQWPLNVISGENNTWKWLQVCRRSPVPFCLCIHLFMVLVKRIAQAATSAPPMRLTI
nr:tail fiber assembly protein [Providencia rettgeri]